MHDRPDSSAELGQLSTSSTQPDPSELAELDALVEELNRLGFPAARLIPPGELPYVDTGLPQGMVPGERIYSQAGTFFWRPAQPIASSNQPATAAAMIARTLTPHYPAPQPASESTMTAYTGPGGEPTLADLEKEFGWTCWTGVDGMSYARRPTTPKHDHDARGEDPLDLRDAIRLALSREAEAAYHAHDGGPAQPGGTLNTGACAL